MELRHLRYFIVLAEELHFGNAARRLFISQPPLSRQIKELEEELGVILLLRDNKRVSLTEAGRFFLEQARKVVGQLESAMQQTNQIHHSLAGEIKIGYISSIDKKKLGELIHHLRDVHPFLQTKLFELPTNRQIQALEDGKLDIGIIRAPNASPLLQSEMLYEDGFSLVFPAAMAIPERLEELANFPFISYHATAVPVYHSQMLAFCAELGFKPTLRHECNNIASILELVELNAGISIVPACVRHQYGHLGVRFFNVEESAIKTEVLLTYQRRQNHPAFSMLRCLMLALFCSRSVT